MSGWQNKMAEFVRWEEDGDIGRIIEALRDEYSEIRVMAAVHLGTIDAERALEPLIEALSDEDEKVRIMATSSLGKIGGAGALEPLIDLLIDEYGAVRRMACSALKEIGEMAVEALLRALQDDDRSRVRSRAAIALGIIGDERSVMPLIEALGDEDEEGGIRIVAMAAAVALGDVDDARAIEPLIEALGVEEESIASGAGGALGRIADEGRLERVIETQGEEDEGDSDPFAMQLDALPVSERLRQVGRYRSLLGDGFTDFEITKMHDAHVPEASGIEITKAIAAFAESRVAFDRDVFQVGPRAQALIDETKSCFVATAACGNPDAWEVAALRSFRDRRLRRTGPGRALIVAYEWLSPPMVHTISHHPSLQRLARRLVVTPLARLAGGRPSD